jgi:hypothetical protein
MTVSRVLSSAMLVLLSFGAVGCGPSPPPQYKVSGAVTLDGTPLDQGTIYFKTVSTGAIESIPIVAGRYEGTAEAGERRIEIASIKVETKEADGMTSQIETNLIPAAYNVDSDLKKTVTPEGPNAFDFDLKSSGK